MLRFVAVVGALVAAVTCAAAAQTGSPLGTMLLLRVAPARVAKHAMVHMRNAANGQDLLLVGTTHAHHLDAGPWSLLELASIVEHAGATRVLVEILPRDLADDRLGDAPIEMGFLAVVARASGLVVHGIDAPAVAGWRARQDAMFALARAQLDGPGRVVLFSGFMHLRAFVRAFADAGFVVVDIDDGERRELLERVTLPSLAPWRQQLLDSIARRQRMAAARDAGAADADDRRRRDDASFIETRRRALTWLDELGSTRAAATGPS